MPSERKHILQLEGLDVCYGGVQAVRGVSLSVHSGEIVGIVGESGSGKSTVLRAIAGLLGASGKVTGGTICFLGEDLTSASPARMAALRGSRISYVFQDPVSSLDPLFTIGAQFDECLRAHADNRMPASELRKTECSLLAEMGFDDPQRVLDSYPHSLSGGMCQRVVLAMALASEPALLLADEPTSALDVVSQQQVSQLLLRIRADHNTSMLVVSHNIAAVSLVADRIGVMYQGQLVEIGPRDAILHDPAHPYTKELISAALYNDTAPSRNLRA